VGVTAAGGGALRRLYVALGEVTAVLAEAVATERHLDPAACKGVVSSVEVAVRKATIGSLSVDLVPAAALEIEPVIRSLLGGCLPLVVALRTAKNPITRTATNPIPSKVRRTAKQMSHMDTQARDGVQPTASDGRASLAKTLLEIGRPHATRLASSCNAIIQRDTRQGGAEHFQQSAEFALLRLLLRDAWALARHDGIAYSGCPIGPPLPRRTALAVTGGERRFTKENDLQPSATPSPNCPQTMIR
jgi:hypothetical protein